MNRNYDCVDEAGRESFPASDPPSWGSSHAAPSASTVVPTAPVDDAAPVTTRATSDAKLWAMRIGSVAAALGALTGAVLLVRRYRA